MTVLLPILLAVQTILTAVNLFLVIRLVRRVQAHRRLDSRLAALLLLRGLRKPRPHRRPAGAPLARDATSGFRDPSR